MKLIPRVFIGSLMLYTSVIQAQVKQLSAYAGANSDQRVVAASVSPDATRIGLSVADAGGNAIDAAIAIAYALGVVDPHNSGIGGGALILVRKANGDILAIDGREMAPAAAHATMFHRHGVPDAEKSRTGALAIGVPGSVKAFELLQQNAGKLTAPDVILPAAELAEKGFRLSNVVALRTKQTEEKLRLFPASAATYLTANGVAPEAGTVWKNPELAATYRQIAKQGSAYFYQGAFATAVDAWMRKNGGVVTANDFKNYQAVLREPIVSRYRDVEIVGFPPPSSGGVHIAQALNILEHIDFKRTTTSERYHVIAETLKRVFADRAAYMGDSDFVSIPKGLLDKGYAAELAKTISLDSAAPLVTAGNPPHDEAHLQDRHTTHIATADTDGNWVAITTTVNTSYGSKVVIPGTGVVMNNQMDDFSSAAGVANAFGLIGSEANAVAAGKRPLSSMTPTLIMKNGEPLVTLGAAGGPTIISQVLQNIIWMVDFGMTAELAIAQPRLHAQWSPQHLFIESSFLRPVRDALEQKGHRFTEWNSIGYSQIIEKRNGFLIPVAEPRVISANAR